MAKLNTFFFYTQSMPQTFATMTFLDRVSTYIVFSLKNEIYTLHTTEFIVKFGQTTF